ncbi:large ribosomal subunit protein mL40 [Tiliqua scincoides]|uniref:large ribosomal subunit protein mL40 n=1 Tax=Tiliqua scincoides TaxID=71010 RepID=UPI0034631E9F
MLAQAAASRALSLLGCRAGGCLWSSQSTWNVQHRESHWQSSLLTLRAVLPMRAEPKRKKKVDPKREIAIRDRMRKKIKRLEKAPQEMIPIEDFTTPFRFMDETRVRVASPISFEESERRALLLKRWAVYKLNQHKEEMKAIESLQAAQEEALKELRLESEELYQAAIRRDDGLFPFERQEPMYTPPVPNYEAPEGKCNDITKVYTQ